MQEQKKYSQQDLKEFEQLINNNLTQAHERLAKLKTSMVEENHNINNINTTTINDNVEIEQRDKLNQLIAHQEKYIASLERAKQRINKGTYGICIVTGKLISKPRLRAVPHTTHSVEAKNKRIKPTRP